MAGRTNVAGVTDADPDELLATLEAQRATREVREAAQGCNAAEEHTYRLVTIAVADDLEGGLGARIFAFAAAKDLGEGRWRCTAIDLDGEGAVRLELQRVRQRNGSAAWFATVGHQPQQRLAWLQAQVRIDFLAMEAAVEASGECA